VADASSLARKLGFKPGATAVVLNPPEGVLELFEPLPEGATLATKKGRTPASLVVLFVTDAASLDSSFPTAQAACKPGGLLWIAYRKGGKKAGTDLNRDILWERMKPHDLIGVTLVAVDGEWSAMRFRSTVEVGT
jgi:hypothetical protein